jgi:hypothetical protein
MELYGYRPWLGKALSKSRNDRGVPREGKALAKQKGFCNIKHGVIGTRNRKIIQMVYGQESGTTYAILRLPE